MFGSAVSAQTLQEHLIEQLKQQGASVIRISRTLLGRTRLVAKGPGYEREIIFNPRTGEILRDYWEKTAGTTERERLLNPRGHSDDRDGASGSRDGGGSGTGDDNSGTGGGGNGGSNDNSGSGSNSGSGGGGGGGGSDHGHDDSGHDDSSDDDGEDDDGHDD